MRPSAPTSPDFCLRPDAGVHDRAGGRPCAVTGVGTPPAMLVPSRVRGLPSPADRTTATAAIEREDRPWPDPQFKQPKNRSNSNERAARQCVSDEHRFAPQTQHPRPVEDRRRPRATRRRRFMPRAWPRPHATRRLSTGLSSTCWRGMASRAGGRGGHRAWFVRRRARGRSAPCSCRRGRASPALRLSVRW
jgi:hypothetical protein